MTQTEKDMKRQEEIKVLGAEIDRLQTAIAQREQRIAKLMHDVRVQVEAQMLTVGITEPLGSSDYLPVPEEVWTLTSQNKQDKEQLKSLMRKFKYRTAPSRKKNTKA